MDAMHSLLDLLDVDLKGPAALYELNKAHVQVSKEVSRATDTEGDFRRVMNRVDRYVGKLAVEAGEYMQTRRP